MKTYQQLTDQEKENALDKAVSNLLTLICEGCIRFSDEKNGDGLQERIDKAFEEAEAMQTPWFAHEYVMDTCAEDINAMAQCDAEDCLYLEDHETAVRL